ncbi:hypothetical protein DFP72DRAFT_1074002 [Ephemerocybe angulata]|uniref:Uncharacterized protein n=1 Tax=Ephemerocybe angulata TaxID=980116 RepID=A0A8H6HMY4_9AGAR|nr:hypothetical protein DFP72DRAFT_1074002 [Tulosesus angulatus]
MCDDGAIIGLAEARKITLSLVPTTAAKDLQAVNSMFESLIEHRDTVRTTVNENNLRIHNLDRYLKNQINAVDRFTGHLLATSSRYKAAGKALTDARAELSKGLQEKRELLEEYLALRNTLSEGRRILWEGSKVQEAKVQEDLTLVAEASSSGLKRPGDDDIEPPPAKRVKRS